MSANSAIPLETELSFENKLEWLSAEEAALFLRIFRRDGTPCVERIRNLASQGRIPFYKPFGRLLFRRSELVVLVEASRKGGFKWR